MNTDFNEKTQAYLIIRWGRRLIDTFGDRGREAFLFAARIYGENRGRRMAMRAIRDGKPLDLSSYLQYKEWVSTEYMRDRGDANQASSSLSDNIYVKKVTRCPWNLQFTEMGETELGNLYCQVIDTSIAAGFSRSFTYQVPQNLNQGVPCRHVVENAGISALPDGIRKEYLKPFDYHCADLHFAFRRTVQSVFGEEGMTVTKQVEQDFREKCGEEMLLYLLSFAGTDFQTIPEEHE